VQDRHVREHNNFPHGGVGLQAVEHPQEVLADPGGELRVRPGAASAARPAPGEAGEAWPWEC
jgi:hypothetical protein